MVTVSTRPTNGSWRWKALPSNLSLLV